MPNFSSTPGGGGIAWIVTATVIASVLMTEVMGIYSHWPFVLFGLAIGLLAVRSINRQ